MACFYNAKQSFVGDSKGNLLAFPHIVDELGVVGKLFVRHILAILRTSKLAMHLQAMV